MTGVFCLMFFGQAQSATPPTVYPANSPGLEGTGRQIVVGPAGVHRPQLVPRSSGRVTTLDLRRTILWANEDSPHPDDKPLAPLPAQSPGRSKYSLPELYPLNGDPLDDGFWFVGGTVVGRQHRGLPWSYIKQLYDGDGLRFEARRGATITVHGMRIDNVEDGVSPRLAADVPHAGAYWKVDGCYFKFIRDDVVENDSLMDGEISDCLVDGTFVFLSQRPGRQSTTRRAEAMTRIRACLVRLQRMPYQRDIGGDEPAPGSIVDGQGHGMLFKFSGAATGKVDVRDTIFLVDGMSVNGAKSMSFPTWEGCTYENVTIVWRGGGKYPGTLPASGVVVTDDLGVWARARAKWIKEHPGALDGM
jgi:hypothetical protein